MDAVYSSLHFERVYLPDEYDGTPKEAYDKLNAVISDYTAKIAECQKEILTILSDEKAVILSAREKAGLPVHEL